MGAIRFPNLGFEVFVEKNFSIGNFEIAFYGITMALSMIFGAIIAYYEAKKTGQKVDDYIDYTLFGIIGGIIGARLYYVAFQWDEYKDNLKEIFNLRAGGMAFYGSAIGAILVAIIFCKIKKMKFWKFTDTAVFGLLLGQIIGRWGNFFNREAYGTFKYTVLSKSIDFSNVGIFKKFAMEIPLEDAAIVKNTIERVTEKGITYVHVVPTFLFESVLNLVLLLILTFTKKKKKFNGEIFCRYLMGYGLIRFFIEGFRADQLTFHGIAVSQALSLAMFVVGLVVTLVLRIKLHKAPYLVYCDKSAGAKAEEAGAEKTEEADTAEKTEEADAAEKTEEADVAENADAVTEPATGETDTEAAVEEVTEEVVEEATEAATEEKTVAQMLAEEVADKTEETVEEATETAEETVGEVTETVEEAAADTTEE